jgi:hypothetical protein
MFDTVYIYVPAKKQIVRIAEGSGDNLMDEDIERGYADYIYYEQFAKECGLHEIDGGMIMLTELFRDKYKSTVESIPDVLVTAFGDEHLPYILLD